MKIPGPNMISITLGNITVRRTRFRKDESESDFRYLKDSTVREKI